MSKLPKLLQCLRKTKAQGLLICPMKRRLKEKMQFEYNVNCIFNN